MSMIGKLDATMYAINHAEETGRNVHRAAGWLSKHSGSINHGLCRPNDVIAVFAAVGLKVLAVPSSSVNPWVR